MIVVETWKTAPYDTYAVLYSITHYGHVQIHILLIHNSAFTQHTHKIDVKNLRLLSVYVVV